MVNDKDAAYLESLWAGYQRGFKQSWKKPLVNLPPRAYNYTTAKNKNQNTSLNFETRIGSAFAFHGSIFYAEKSSKKNLHHDSDVFYDLLTPKAHAHWYMCDGSAEKT